jgi:glycosyltransferase involved in cell wall biosynthesis
VSALVTIAIPTRNRVEYLRQAVKSALAQTYVNIEVVISDNGSEDGTREYLQSLSDERLRVLWQVQDIGMVANWNACLAAARGEFFLLLSDDDFLESQALERLVSGFNKAGANHQEIGLTYCRTAILNEAAGSSRSGMLSPMYESGQDLILNFFHGRRHLFPCSLMMKVADMRAVGNYPAFLHLACDAYVWMSIASRGGAAVFVSETLATYRQHDANLTRKGELEKWLEDGETLVKLVGDELRKRDAAELMAAGDRYITRTACSLLLASFRQHGSWKRSAHEFRALRKYLRGGYAPWTLLSTFSRMLFPEALEQQIKSLR